ncbi:hypothetical protein [Coleofasciculus sp.]|uniref:hypothetical protein n=1 Tax=Coleofasciculus sp. TaxID=3100458 RepID=UPI003A34020A
MTKQRNLSATKIIIALQVLLTPVVLGTVSYWVINSDFQGVIQLKLNRDGGEVLIDRRSE